MYSIKPGIRRVALYQVCQVVEGARVAAERDWKWWKEKKKKSLRRLWYEVGCLCTQGGYF